MRPSGGRLTASLEVLGAVLIFAVSQIGYMPTPTIPLVLMAWLLMRLRGRSLRGLGLEKPADWARTLGAGAIIAVVYQAADMLLTVPIVGQITGTPIDLDRFTALRGDLPMQVAGLLIAWSPAACSEQLVFWG